MAMIDLKQWDRGPLGQECKAETRQIKKQMAERWAEFTPAQQNQARRLIKRAAKIRNELECCSQACLELEEEQAKAYGAVEKLYKLAPGILGA